jgi:hypothetical protein
MNKPGPTSVSLPGDIHQELYVMALVAARARNRAPFVWVVSRFARTLGTTEAYANVPEGTTGLSEVLAWIANPRAEMLEVVSRLRDAGALSVAGPVSAPTHLSLSLNASGHYLLRKVVSRLMSGARRPAQTVEKLTAVINGTSGLQISERTAWRWVRGEVAPDADTLARVAVAVFKRDGADIALSQVRGFVSAFVGTAMRVAASGLTLGETDRAMKWLLEAAEAQAGVVNALMESSTDASALERYGQFLGVVEASINKAVASVKGAKP